MSEQDPRERDPRERPPDPAGTRPRHDPESLLPATREPLLRDDVVESEVVDEREEERGDLLPARRRPGSPAEAVPAAHQSQYAPRFHFLTGALVAIGLAALVGLALFIALPGGGKDNGPQWSSWEPSKTGMTGAEEIAEHVGPGYKLTDGHQMVDVSVTGLELEGVPLAVAVREPPAQGGDIRVFDDNGLIYRLCGLGPDCAIASGKPSTQRHLLLRREALELALYSFRYLDVHQVIVFMPPRLGQKPNQALFFREGDVARELDRPLNASLSPRVPTVRNVTLSPDTPLVDQLTTPKIFQFSLTQANTDNRGFIVLDPFDASSQAQPGTGSSSGSSGSSSGSSGSSSGSSGSSSTTSTGATTNG
jgi:uncharacterized membrane protein YgcG